MKSIGESRPWRPGRVAGIAAACLLAATALGQTQPPHAPRIAVPAGPPPGRAMIWVLHPDNKLAAYDALDFHPWLGLALPPEAQNNVDGLAISRTGEVLVRYPAAEGSALRRVWQSDPHYGATVVQGADEKRPAPGGGALVTTATPDVYFSADGRRLFWFETRAQRLMREDDGDVSREASFLAWSSDRRGDDPRTIAEVPFPKCACATGACDETCPEAKVWAPPAGVTDFFFVTRWVPGQIGSQFLTTELYQLANGRWTPRKLPQAVEQIEDAADHGNLFLETIADGGCCGWTNEGDDQMLVTRNGQRTVIFGERGRFHNDTYDVSFYTPVARFSADAARVGYTLASTHQPGDEIRLGSNTNKENPEELRRVKQAIAELPRAEVVALADPKKIVLSVPGEFAGWLDPQRVLVLQAGELFVIEVATAARKPTGIKAVKAVFVR